MERVLLKRPVTIINNNEDSLVKANFYIKMCNAIVALAKANKPIYIQILHGDWAGSIARLVVENSEEHSFITSMYDRKNSYVTGYVRGYLTWDGSKNKVKFSSIVSEFAWLADYTGPTVYTRVDKKQLAATILAKKKFNDRYGKELNVGDSVMYVDIRYGNGTSIERGTVSEMIVKAKTAYIVILNEDGVTKSTIEKAENLIAKI